MKTVGFDIKSLEPPRVMIFSEGGAFADNCLPE